MNKPVKIHDCTEVGNAERLVHHFGEEFRFVPAWGEFLTWSSKHWNRDVEGVEMQRLSKDAIKRIKDEARWGIAADSAKAKAHKKSLLAWAKKSASRSTIDSTVKLTKSEPGVVLDHNELDRNNWLLNCSNGTVDLKTGKLRAHRPNDLLTKMSKVRYDPKARCPRWEAFLEQVLPDKGVRDYLQRFIGYCLTGEVSERQFLLLYGTGKNGKSVFLKVLRLIFGPYAGTMEPGLLLARDAEAHPTGVAALFGLRLAIASEVKQGRAFDEEAVKRMTGNDELSARRMREDWWSFWPTHKMIMALNDLPRVRDVTPSFWDRTSVIPFNVRIADDKDDKNLAQKLCQTEGSGIFGWCVRGCLKWQREGLGRSTEVASAVAEYRDQEDTVGRFFEECLSFGRGTTTVEIADKDGHVRREQAKFEVTNADLSRTVKDWCEKYTGGYSFSDRTIGSRLKALGAAHAVNLGPNHVRGWSGVRVRFPRERVALQVVAERREKTSSKAGAGPKTAPETTLRALPRAPPKASPKGPRSLGNLLKDSQEK